MVVSVCLWTIECSVQSHVDLFKDGVSEVVTQCDLTCCLYVICIIEFQLQFQFKETIIQIDKTLLRIDLKIDQ